MKDQTGAHKGEVLRQLRSIAGLTLQQVAEGADTSIAYLSKVERDKFSPTDEYVAKVAAFISASMLKAAA